MLRRLLLHTALFVGKARTIIDGFCRTGLLLNEIPTPLLLIVLEFLLFFNQIVDLFGGSIM